MTTLSQTLARRREYEGEGIDVSQIVTKDNFHLWTGLMVILIVGGVAVYEKLGIGDAIRQNSPNNRPPSAWIASSSVDTPIFSPAPIAAVASDKNLEIVPKTTDATGGDKEAGVLKRPYPDSEIRTLLQDPKAIPGSSAILIDKSFTAEPLAVRIPAQIPGTGKTKIEFILNGTIVEIATAPENLLSPQEPLENWIRVDDERVPEQTPLVATRKSLQKGIDWINQYYRSNGIDEARVYSVSEMKANWLTGHDNVQLQIRRNDSEAQPLIEDIPIVLFLDPVRGTNGGAYTDSGGVAYYSRTYQSEIDKMREIWKELHEFLHTTNRVELYSAFYNAEHEDPLLMSAWENYNNAVAFLALQAVYGGHSAERDKAIDSMINPYILRWYNGIISDFDKKGLRGRELLILYGSRGDMIGLKDQYEQQYGKGSFAKTGL